MENNSLKHMFNDHEKAVIVSLLLEMANVDSKVTFEELVNSNSVNARLGISRSVFELGRGLDIQYAIHAVKSMTGEQQARVAQLLVDMIDCDSEVKPSELQLLNYIGQETGLDKLFEA